VVAGGTANGLLNILCNLTQVVEHRAGGVALGGANDAWLAAIGTVSRSVARLRPEP
jgi:hypothetical protein